MPSRQLKRNPLPCVFLAALLLCAAFSAQPFPCRAGASAEKIPGGAAVLLTLDVKEDDPGQKWLFDSLTNYLLSRSGKAKDDARIKDVDLFTLRDISFALFPRKGGKKAAMLLAGSLAPGDGSFSLSYGKTKLKLNVRNGDSTQRNMLGFLLSAACRVPPGEDPTDGVFFNPGEEESSRLSAYHLGDPAILLASNSGLVRSALKGKGGAVSTGGFRETIALLPKGWDAYGYADGENPRFTASPGEGWQLFIASLLEGVKSLGLAVDVTNADNSSLVLALVPDDPGGVGDLRKRLEPNLPVLVSQFLDGRITSSIEFEETPKALRITARLRNTRAFWEKLFHHKSAR